VAALSKRSRPLTATVTLLILSTLIPIWAAITPGEPATTAGIIDVALAALLFLQLALLYRKRHAVTEGARARSYEICRWLALFPLLLFLIYLSGASVKWDVLLIGLGWRCWYLVTVLPYLVVESDRRT
jgi:hypothetical protein